MNFEDVSTNSFVFAGFSLGGPRRGPQEGPGEAPGELRLEGPGILALGARIQEGPGGPKRPQQTGEGLS